MHCLSSTLRIKTPRGTSSAFVMDHGGHQWLVTARHVVDRIRGDEIEVLDATGVGHSNLRRLPEPAGTHQDVAVFRMWTEGLEFGTAFEAHLLEDISVVQDAYFLGFPNLGDGLAYVEPAKPLIKAAIVSGQAIDNAGTPVWLLDGMASGGFSGGPLIIEEKETGAYGVFAVVSGYVPDIPPVHGRMVEPPGAEPEPGRPQRGSVRGNTGVVIGFDIRHAVDAIEACW